MFDKPPFGQPLQINDVVKDSSQFWILDVVHCDVRTHDAVDDEFSSFAAFTKRTEIIKYVVILLSSRFQIYKGVPIMVLSAMVISQPLVIFPSGVVFVQIF